MTNNLKRIEKELRTFAKRCRDVKYNSALLFTFLLTGLISFTAPETDSVEQARRGLQTSITDMKKLFKEAKAENNKLLKSSNLELIQLMEQGDHVVKSPWSSWQFGMNYFYSDWRGTYKGRGDKKEKYPYEGILTRDTNEFNRYVATNSNFYGAIAKSSNPAAASSSSRQGIGGYGIASNRTQPEPIVSLELSAGITPRFVNKGAIILQAPQPATPNVPTAINFKPVTPQIVAPEVDAIDVPDITPPGTGNDDSSWIYTESTSLKLDKVDSGGTPYYTANKGGSVNVGVISQQDMDGGKLTVTANGTNFNVTSKDVTFTGRYDANHNSSNAGAQKMDFSIDATRFYAAMKLVGGHAITVNSDIDYKGTGSLYNKWLFHTDGHNNFGDSTWVLKSNVNMDGNNLIMYTSQYHGSGNYNIGFLNDGGTITTSSTGSNNYIWLPVAADNWGGFRIMMFENKGTISLNGTKDTLSFFGSEGDDDAGGITFINNGTLELNGEENKGIIIKPNKVYTSGEILLNNPMKITGNKAIGLAFLGYINLEAGKNFHQSTADNVKIALGATTRESVLKVDMSDNEKATAVFFNNAGTTPFVVNNFNLTSTNGKKNNLVFIKDGVVKLDGTTSGKLTITKGESNVGIYTEATDNLTTAAEIKIDDSNSSTAIFAKKTGTITNTGDISVTGKSVKAIIADQKDITSSGKITLSGTALSETDGAVGLVAQNGGKITSTGLTSISVDGSASIDAYSNNGTLDLTNVTLKATNGAFNTYASNNGVVKLNTATLNTGQKSLAFFVDNTGKIEFTGATTANIDGWTNNDPLTRGTAFYYTGSGYSSFTDTDIQTWVGARFANMNNLTLNMATGSRLFIASDVEMNLSNTGGTTLAGALGVNSASNLATADYKTFMLYLSRLKLDQSINLDDPTDAYNKLEISNSQIINNNSNTISGTNAGQVAFAQENLDTNRTKVTLSNNGIMNMSGANSTAMYGKFGVLENNATGTITMGDSSTALYGIDNSLVSNAGTIAIGANSTALYSKGATVGAANPAPITNSGTITSAGANAIGIIYDGTGTSASGSDIGVNNTATGKIQFTGDKSVGIYAQGSNYIVDNSGEITLGDSTSIANPNVGVFTNVTNIGIANRAGGNITVGNNAIGTYGYRVSNDGVIKAGDAGVGIYSKGDSTILGSTSDITVGKDEAVGVYLEQGGGTVTHDGKMTIGDNSFGFVAIQGSNPLVFTNTSTADVLLGTKSIYVYSNDTTGTITNNALLTSTGQNYGLYGAGTITNNADINFSNGLGNVGIYSIKGGTATNAAGRTITVGDSDPGNSLYSIGMAAGYAKSDTGKVVNAGTINVNGKSSIGMYASGRGSEVENASGATINLAGEGAMGIYLDNGAKGINNGLITTVGSPATAVGVVVRAGSELINNGTININSAGGYAKFITTGGIVKNFGTITVSGGAADEFTPGSKPTGKELEINGVKVIDISAPAGAATATITANGAPVTPVVTNVDGNRDMLTSNIGMYIDTKRGTNPIQGPISALGGNEADLIIGAEAAETTLSKYIQVPQEIIAPYNTTLLANPNITNWNIYSGALTWMATATLDKNTGLINNIYLAKMPYTAFAGKEATPVEVTDTYNFLDGLEQRYGKENLSTREKQLFDKLSGIGKNEEILFYQATDEMMGHQYANVQQRTYGTGRLIDKEISHLSKEWDTKSKQSNKIKAFGMRDEYNTDTAGIIDYTSNAYGFAYLHEDETVKLGNASGWYAGAVHNRFKFKDIGKSKENQTMLKLGIFKTMSPAADHNGSLRWTISGEGYVSRNDMHRKYLVVDEIFNAKSDYTTYGVAVKNELGYNIRTSERTSIRPYGSLKLEYGRFTTIKEKSGEMRLDVKGNDYYSIRPEVGVEFSYRQPMAVKTTFVTTLGLGYENELGKVGNVKNMAKVSYTDADWFNIRGEKDDRKGNFKADLNIGIENQRFGVTLNGGYDTKGKNVRGGIGFRAIY